LREFLEQNGGDVSKDESLMDLDEVQEVMEAAPAVAEQPAPAVTPAAPAKVEPVATTPVKAEPIKVASPVVAAASPAKPVVAAASPAKPVVAAASPAKPVVAAASPAKPVVAAAKPEEPVKVEETAKPEESEAANGKDDAAKPAEGEAAGERKGVKRKRYEEEPFVVVEDEPEIDESLFCLDWYNSDLSLKIDKATLMSAEPLYKDGWGYVW